MDISKLRPDSTSDKIGEARIKGGAGAAKTSKTREADSASNAPEGPAPASNTADKVRLSPDAQAVREGVEAAKTAPDTRAEKVAVLKAQIKNGQYKVDEKAVAEKMIRQSLEEDIQGRME